MFTFPKHTGRMHVSCLQALQLRLQATFTQPVEVGPTIIVDLRNNLHQFRLLLTHLKAAIRSGLLVVDLW